MRLLSYVGGLARDFHRMECPATFDINDVTLASAFDGYVASGTFDLDRSLFAQHGEHVMAITRIVLRIAAATGFTTGSVGDRPGLVGRSLLLQQIIGVPADRLSKATVQENDARARSLVDVAVTYEFYASPVLSESMTYALIDTATARQAVEMYDQTMRTFAIQMHNFARRLLDYYVHHYYDPSALATSDVDALLAGLQAQAWFIDPWNTASADGTLRVDDSGVEAHSLLFLRDLYQLVDDFGADLMTNTSAVQGSSRVAPVYLLNGMRASLGPLVANCTSGIHSSDQMTYDPSSTNLLSSGGDFAAFAGMLLANLRDVRHFVLACVSATTAMSDKDLLGQFARLSTQIGSVLSDDIGVTLSSAGLDDAVNVREVLAQNSAVAAMRDEIATLAKVYPPIAINDIVGEIWVSDEPGFSALRINTCMDVGLRDAVVRAFNAAWFVDWTLRVNLSHYALVSSPTGSPAGTALADSTATDKLALVGGFLSTWAPAMTGDTFFASLDYTSMAWVVQWTYTVSEFVNMFVYVNEVGSVFGDQKIDLSAVEQTYRDMQKYETLMARGWGTVTLFDGADEDAREVCYYFTLLLEAMHVILVNASDASNTNLVTATYPDPTQAVYPSWGALTWKRNTFGEYALRTLYDGVTVASSGTGGDGSRVLYIDGKAIGNLLNRARVMLSPPVFTFGSNADVSWTVGFDGAVGGDGANRWFVACTSSALAESDIDLHASHAAFRVTTAANVVASGGGTAAYTSDSADDAVLYARIGGLGSRDITHAQYAAGASSTWIDVLHDAAAIAGDRYPSYSLMIMLNHENAQGYLSTLVDGAHDEILGRAISFDLDS